MKRVVALSVAITYLSVATAFAQEPIVRHATAFRPVTFAPPTPTPRVSLVPAIPQLKITALATSAPAVWTPAPRMNLSAMAALAQNGKSSKSFWKTPWPYVIAGAVAVGVVVARRGYKSKTPGCSDPSCSVY
jgi:hypothetical protein